MAADDGTTVLEPRLSIVIDDVHCDACSAHRVATGVTRKAGERLPRSRGVRLGITGTAMGLVLCAFHAGEASALLLSVRGRF